MKKLVLKLAIVHIFFLTGCDDQVNLNVEHDKTYDTHWINSGLEDFKKNEKIKGLAFAIFDSTDIIEEFCLGKSTYNFPINRHTIFSIQSVSKNVTALAVMFAIQDSLVMIDNPISQYIPDFKIQSCFENNPEQRITLEMLLSHTAGLAHEAPVGNNFYFDPCTFTEHLNSISETWLKFPAGSNYAYSNLGYDVAAYIVEQTSGLDFNDYLTKRIFAPLGMESTTINDRDVIESTNKTEGTIPFTKNNHLKIPLIGSGAVYTNLNDFIKYVQFLMCNGYADETFLNQEYLFNMYKIRRNNYGLGTYIGKNKGNYFVNHNGGGYGYSASFIWFPEFNLGGILLCNKPSKAFSTTNKILNEFITRTKRKKEPSLSNTLHEINLKYFENLKAHNFTQKRVCTNDTLFKASWEKYLGTYSLESSGLDLKWYAKLALDLGYHPQKLEIYREDNVIKIKSHDGISMLREFKEGIFFTNDGEVVDLNSENPTYRNIKLEKIK